MGRTVGRKRKPLTNSMLIRGLALPNGGKGVASNIYYCNAKTFLSAIFFRLIASACYAHLSR